MLGPATLSTLKASSLGLLRSTSSVGVSGDIGIAVSVMSRSWSATAFRGLSPPGEGPGLPRAAGGAGIDIGTLISYRVLVEMGTVHANDQVAKQIW